MIKKELVLGLIISLGILSGCQEVKPTAVQPKETVHETKPIDQVSQEESIKNKFLQQVKIGMSEEQIRALFGAHFALVQNTMEGNETWRFDLGASKDYEFQDQGIDQVDVEGIKSGRVKQQLFIDWDETGLVKSAALFTLEQKDLYEYRMLPDGSIEEKKNPA